MKREIEKILTEQLKIKKAQHVDHEHSASITINEVKIADIVFAFNNSNLINLLRERGRYIMY
jgi:hypothetical protein